MAINRIPAGLWKIDGNNIVHAPSYNEAEIFSMNGTIVAANAPQLAGNYTNIFFNDPSRNGDEGLATYATELSIGNAVLLNDFNYFTDYNINHTSPSYVPSQASSSQTTNSAGSSGGTNSTNSSNAGASGNNATANSSAGASGSYAPSSSQGSYGGFGSMTAPASGATNPIYNDTPSYGISLSGANGTSNNPSNYNPWSMGFGPYGTMGAGANSGKLTAPKDDDTSGKINSRIALIEKYCNKYGNTVDLAKLREECSKDPEKGLEKCDNILNNEFDQNRLKKLVTKEYEEYNKAKLDAGKQVSEQWVEEISKSGLDRAQLTTGGVTKDTILDVVGTFMTNDKVKAGRVSMEQVFEKPEVVAQLIDTIKARADEDLANEKIDDGTKDNISKYIGSLRDNYDKYQESIEDDNKHNDLGFNEVRNQLVYVFMELEKTLRGTEAIQNDKIAKKHYGLPDDSSITLNQQTNRFNEEQSAYNNRKRLSTQI